MARGPSDPTRDLNRILLGTFVERDIFRIGSQHAPTDEDFAHTLVNCDDAAP